ncbi:MAG: DAK2 domain-containing protein [Clostridia bacterium]|nr:DAK2 domain-containing protein [Clostridia bacterium]
MEIKTLDGKTFRRILQGGADGILANIEAINELNVFPVPDGDTGTNMSLTIESGLSRIPDADGISLGAVAQDFAKGSLFGARGNSGVILSQFFAGMCDALTDKEAVSAKELAAAYMDGVKRAYAAVSNPTEGTILTVVRESAEYALANLSDQSTPEEFFRLHIEEAERSLLRTKDILPVLTEADVVDSGGAGYLCIAKGMYETLRGNGTDSVRLTRRIESQSADYDLFTTDSELTYGYCTECLVRLQRAKGDPAQLDEKAFVNELERMGCDSIVTIRDGDVLKLHAHTATPSDILTLCQRYGEFLNVKIENMSLQHSERMAVQKKKTPHKRYGVVTVATGDGLTALFESLGADAVINGGQTGNPAAEQFLEAFESLDVDCILVLPNNGNILLTAEQAAELWEGGNAHVIPTKTLPQGYAALSVFNAAAESVDELVADMVSAKDAVASGEVTEAVRDSTVGGIAVKAGEYIGILDGDLVTSGASVTEALCGMIEQIEDLDDRELITLFVGDDVSEDERVQVTEALAEHFPELSVEVYIGGQKIYGYLVAVE